MKTAKNYFLILAILVVVGMSCGNLWAQNTMKRPAGITIHYVEGDPSDWEYDFWQQYVFHYDDEGRIIGLDWNDSDGERGTFEGLTYQLPSSISSADGLFQATLQDGRIVNIQMTDYYEGSYYTDNIQYGYDSNGQCVYYTPTLNDDGVKIEWQNGDITSAVYFDDEYWHFTCSDETAHPFVLMCISPLSTTVDEVYFTIPNLLYNYFGAIPRHLISHVRITDEYGGGDVEDLDYRYTRNADGDVVAVDIVAIDEGEEDELVCIEFFWETVDAVNDVRFSSHPQRYYSLDGRQLTKARKGINIVQVADGTYHKIIQK